MTFRGALNSIQQVQTVPKIEHHIVTAQTSGPVTRAPEATSRTKNLSRSCNTHPPTGRKAFQTNCQFPLKRPRKECHKLARKERKKYEKPLRCLS